MNPAATSSMPRQVKSKAPIIYSDIDRIRDALQFVPVGGHDDRVRMAFMLKAGLGEAGRDLWDEWRGDRGDDEADAVWKSASANGSLKIGTLFYESRLNGWRDDGMHQHATPEEIAERQRMSAELAAEEDAKKMAKRADAATKADAIWKQAKPAPPDNPYLARKRVSPVPTLREVDADMAAKILGYPPKFGDDLLTGRLLVVPVKIGDNLSTVELIDGDKQKSALYGGAKVGGYWATQQIPATVETLLVGEGAATVLSASAATRHPGIAALSSCNLVAVAKAMRERYPAAALVILADLVKATGEPDPHAIEAARTVGGKVAIPDFGTDRDPGMKDMNDLAVLCGSEAIQRAIAGASEPPRGMPPSGAEVLSGGDAAPRALPDSLLPVRPFDFSLLPDTLAPWARDICERVQCAPDFIAVAIMAGLGSIIGRKVGIRPQARTDWTVTPNQWALIVGRPGVLKSPAIEAALSPIKRLASAATDMHQAEIEQHRIAMRVAKLAAEEGEKSARKLLAKMPGADVSHLLHGEEPDPPILRRYIAVDSNAASLGELHRQNHNGLLVHRDEMVSLLRSLDREDQSEARGFYLTGWNGDSAYTFDRIGRGLNLHIPAVCLSLLGSTQPGRIAEYIRHAVRGGAGDDGLIQRFGLLIWPDTGGDWKNVDRWPDSTAKKEAHRVFDYLDKLDPATVGALQDTDHDGEPEGIPYLRFDDAALGLFVEWRTDLEARVRGGDLHPALESHLAKYRKLVPSLALILHLANSGTGSVTERALLQSLAWAEYLETHARRAYASVTVPEVAAAKAIIQRIRKGDLSREFSSRDVWRPGWTLLADRDHVVEALNLLVDYDWLIATTRRPDTVGRPATIYTVNPRGFQ